MLPCVGSVIDSQRTSKCGNVNISDDTLALRLVFHFFCSYRIFFNVICDLLHNRRTVIRNLLVKSYILYCFNYCDWFQKIYYLLLANISFWFLGLWLSSIKNEWLTIGQYLNQWYKIPYFYFSFKWILSVFILT